MTLIGIPFCFHFCFSSLQGLTIDADMRFQSVEEDSANTSQLYHSHHHHITADHLDEINQSIELQCLIQEHIDNTTYGNSTEYCLTQFDTILCWSRTIRGTLAMLPCRDEFKGIQYDTSRKSTNQC